MSSDDYDPQNLPPAYTYNDSLGYRWKCKCGASSGGRRYQTHEEAVKRMIRHCEKCLVIEYNY